MIHMWIPVAPKVNHLLTISSAYIDWQQQNWIRQLLCKRLFSGKAELWGLQCNIRGAIFCCRNIHLFEWSNLPIAFKRGESYMFWKGDVVQLELEGNFPTQFLFGIGGPKQSCHTKIETGQGLLQYLMLSLCQFRSSDFLLFC